MDRRSINIKGYKLIIDKTSVGEFVSSARKEGNKNIISLLPKNVSKELDKKFPNIRYLKRKRS